MAKVALLQSFTAVLWAGFVLAVSWMEAWVKFRAPLLAKHVAYDVGRHVFRGLNAVEMPLAASLLALGFVGSAGLLMPGALAAILALQVLCLTPLLERLAFFRIVEAFDTSDKNASQEKLALVRELEAKISGSSAPPVSLHIVYVVLEGMKVVGLVSYAIELCSAHLPC